MAIVPNSRPKATRKEVLDMIGNPAGITQAFLVGVRGYYRDTMGKAGANDQGMYDDAIYLITPTRFVSYNANTDPQKVGAKLAKLDAGTYLFYRGKHKQKYDALRTYPEGKRLPCTRDGVKSMCQYINIHRGGKTDTFSAGCQTIWPDQYEGFINDVYSAMNLFNQDVISDVL